MVYEIGTRIRKFREEKNITQKLLADKIGVSSSRVSNWEQGVNRPDVDLLADICRALNVSPSELLDVRLSSDDFNDHERRIITAYRTKTELQQAVNILLGVIEP
jgi:transcriptional regulator with XRE-family HTH domain